MSHHVQIEKNIIQRQRMDLENIAFNITAMSRSCSYIYLCTFIHDKYLIMVSRANNSDYDTSQTTAA